jgi:membrane protein implicated in regulation of membrane protease activity
MPGVFFGNWWESMSLLQQSLWLVAVASSLLLLILIVMSLLQPETEAATNARLSKIFNPRTILAFLTFFGWIGLLASYYMESQLFVLLLASTAGLLAAATAKGITLMLLRLAPRPSQINTDRIMLSTGRVLHTVPSHRNGFGKVHLDMRGLPYEIEAMTAGTELKAGDAVRVVGVLEDRVLLVEPIEEDNGYPHEQHRLGR